METLSKAEGVERRKNTLVNWIINLTLALFCLIGILVGLEFAARRIATIKPIGARPYPYTYDDTIGWAGKPGYKAWMQDWNRPVLYDMNQWGFRGREPVPIEKTQGKRRVIFLGDSFIDGLGINCEDRITERVERADSNIVPYNLTIGGYSTDQELLTLQRYGNRIKPQVVLLFFCLNDIPYNDSKYAYGIAKPQFDIRGDSTLRLENVPVPKRWLFVSALLWSRDHTVLGRKLFQFMDAHPVLGEWVLPDPGRLTVGIKGMEVRHPNFDSLLVWGGTYKNGATTRLLLREIRDEVHQLGADYIMFTAPNNQGWTETRDDSPPEIQVVLKWCQDYNIEVIDLFPVFRDDYRVNGQPQYIYDRMHWNERGNMLATRAVLERLHSAKEPKVEGPGGNCFAQKERP